MTTRSRWRRLSELFDAALELPVEDRVGWLAGACPDTPEVQVDVLEMLAAHVQTGVLDSEVTLGSTAPLHPLPERVGSSVGPYQILEELGRGGMGVVYKARDERLDRFVALKFLGRGLAESPKAAQHFLNEARAASALDHPNICTVYDVGESDDGHFYIAMAYCEGETLSSRIARSSLQLRESVEIAAAIAEGLACAHAAGIVHRDVKPSNVVLTSRGDIKILDFGVAKLERDAQAAPRGVVGTLAYAAPEQLSGREVDARADVWSLGVVLYEMIAQERPFAPSEGSALSMARGILEQEARPLKHTRPDVTPELERVVLRALARKPEDRFRDAREFAAALKSASLTLHDPVRDLPEPMTSFVGRSAELARAESLIGSTRLLTLTGPGGTGKTRLAIELAKRMAGSFRDGARFVSLAAISEASQVLVAIAESLGLFRADSATPRSLIAAVESREMLLVLDNFEQVVSASKLVADLLRGASGLKVVVTSRVPLHLSGEHEMAVPPLTVPSAESGADVKSLMHTASVRLFVDRARATNPDFALDFANAPAVGEICRRLDGLPLGIELAAARTKFMSPQAMVARLGSRLDLLASADRERPSRHQTLRQALAWSYDLLDTDQRSVFRRAGVFVNGSSLEAMEAVCAASGGDSARILDSIFLLADHSLFARRDAQDGEPRFYLLETMREYALELLQRSGEEDEVRGAHARYFAQMTAQSAVALTGNDQSYWFRRLDADHDNIRAALHWLSGHNEPESALRIAVSIWRFWTARGCQREGRTWMERLLDQAVDASPELRADALNGCGTLAHGSGDLTGARTFLQQALQLYRENHNTYGIGMALNNLAWVATEMGEYEEARVQAEEALQMQQRIRDIRGMAVALNNLGWIANYRAEFDAARSFHQRSIALRREAGDYRGLAFGLTNLSWVEQRAGHYEKAWTLSEEALDVLQDVRDEVLRAWARQQRGAIAYETGRIDEALADIASALPVWNSVGNSSGHAFGVFYQTLALIHGGDVNQASAVMGRAAADPDSMTHRWGAAVLLLASSHLAYAKGDTGEAIVNVVKAIFCFSSFGDRRSLADAYEWLACIVWDDDPSEAREALRIAGDLRQQIGVPPPPCSRAALERVLVAAAH